MKYLKKFENFSDEEHSHDEGDNWKVVINNEVISYWESKQDAITDGALEYLNAISGYLLFTDDSELSQTDIGYGLDELGPEELYAEFDKLIKKANELAKEEKAKDIKIYCLDDSDDDFKDEDGEHN